MIEEYLRRARGIAVRPRNEYLADPYAAVQDDLVYQILQENLPDFEQFVADVARWLRKTSGSE